MAPPTFDPEEVINLVSSDVEHSPTKKRRLDEDSDLDTSPNSVLFARDTKRLKTNPAAEAEAQREASLSAEEGEINEIEVETFESSPSDGQTETKLLGDGAQGSGQAAQPNIASTPKIGWNTSISKTIARTSLQSIAKASVSPDAPLFKQDSLEFKLPSLSEKKQGSWFDRFKDWVGAFQVNNSAHAQAITPALVLNAYTHYIETLSGLKPKKRKSAKQASKEFESTGALVALLQSNQSPDAPQQTKPLVANPVMASRKGSDGERTALDRRSEKENGHSAERNDDASDSEVEFEPMMSKPPQKTEAIPSASEWASLLGESAKANGNSKASQMQEETDTLGNGNLPLRVGIPMGDDALEQQRRYFPSASNPSEMCLLCGREGHGATSCPTLICTFCGDYEHSELYCPTRVRCEKCRQLGHQKPQCTEKLALTKDEGLACALCNSSDHLETQCTGPWRSFHPEAGSINQVVFIPASCSLCGSIKHFSADCNRRRSETPNPTWSIKNRDQYVNATCGQLSVEEAVAGPNNGRATRGPELKIRGQATRTTHVHYSESEDSEVEFLGRRPVQQRAPLGQIRMASNIQMPQNTTSRNDNPPRVYNLRNRSQTPSHPPLPPGPPPPGPPSRQGSYGYPPPPGAPGRDRHGLGQPPGLPHPLPVKPPARDYRNVPPPPHLRGPDGQSRNQNDRDNASQGSRPRGGQRGGRGGGGRGGRGGGRGRGRGRGK